MKNSNYWFIIEPYVYVNFTDHSVLLYNTLDGNYIESEQKTVVDLLRLLFIEEQCGVILLEQERLNEPSVGAFINDLRRFYMGDIIDVNLSKGKPVQVLPYFNYPCKREKRNDFKYLEYISRALFEVNLHIDHITDVLKLIAFLHTVPQNVNLNLIHHGSDLQSDSINLLMDFLSLQNFTKQMSCSYTDFPIVEIRNQTDLSYNIIVDFPINVSCLENVIRFGRKKDLSIGYIFNITSIEDLEESENIIETYEIEKYKMTPIYTKNNIQFFKDNVFLRKDDILSAHLSMRDLFRRRLINENDFGRIHVLGNGDVHANMNHPKIANIYVDTIGEIIQKEINEGRSWLRTRNQYPCDKCLYQDICPSPSDYEIILGRPNLCHVHNV